MKKVLFILLAMLMILSLCACRMGDDTSTPTTTQPTTSEPISTMPTILDPTILDPTIETNIPDTNVDDDHLMDPTEDSTDEASPEIRNRFNSKN